MKKYYILLISIAMIISLVSCSDVKIDYGKSSLFKKEEIDLVANMLQDNLAKKAPEYDIYKIIYLGDNMCNHYLEKYNSSDNETKYVAFMFLKVYFKTPKDNPIFGGSGAFEYLYAKDAEGIWHYQNSGTCL